jgi:hypothetical protein
MRRRLKTLRAKSGHSQNGSPRTLVDLAQYREHHNFINDNSDTPHYDTGFSGWSNASRPRDSSISLRSITPRGT